VFYNFFDEIQAPGLFYSFYEKPKLLDTVLQFLWRNPSAWIPFYNFFGETQAPGYRFTISLENRFYGNKIQELGVDRYYLCLKKQGI
jgi:hypothetical protein